MYVLYSDEVPNTFFSLGLTGNAVVHKSVASRFKPQLDYI